MSTRFAGKVFQVRESGRSQPFLLQGKKQWSSWLTSMKRMGQPKEVADVILWLSSDQSSFITGHAMPVDGGAFAK